MAILFLRLVQFFTFFCDHHRPLISLTECPIQSSVFLHVHPLIIVRQNLLKSGSLQGHRLRAVLAHADPVSVSVGHKEDFVFLYCNSKVCGTQRKKLPQQHAAIVDSANFNSFYAAAFCPVRRAEPACRPAIQPGIRRLLENGRSKFLFGDTYLCCEALLRVRTFHRLEIWDLPTPDCRRLFGCATGADRSL